MTSVHAQRPRDLGIEIGILDPGPLNAITDVSGVAVGHFTQIQGDSIRTGVTAILPHSGNIFQQKVPAAIHVGNGFGKLMGYTQVAELGEIETPIILTNTLSVPTAANALISYILADTANLGVRSVNPIVGETNDGYLNDIRGRHIEPSHVQDAIRQASSGMVEEGNVGAGTGTICFGYKGGIGSSSRQLPSSLGGYTVGVLVQTNFGGVLQIAGVPVGKELDRYYLRDHIEESADGSCIIVVATDAPLDDRNLRRLAKRAMFGLAQTGGIASNGSGDYVIAFSTAEKLRRPHRSESSKIGAAVLRNDHMSPLFLAANEATEEAIINSLFAARTMTGVAGREIRALPHKEVLQILHKYGRLKK